jgi:hypothetical protein
MMISMPKKKGPSIRPTHISFRLKPAELEPLDADRKALPGVPVARNTYAKHAVSMYPKLRKLEEMLRRDAATGSNQDSQSLYASDVLKEAGL